MRFLYKQIYLIIILLLNKSTIITIPNSRNLYNPYKNTEIVKHSLFQERNDINRLSTSPNGLPFTYNDTEQKIEENMSEEQKIAKRIVDHYLQIFDYLDYAPVDNLLSSKELCEGFENYNWPRPLEVEDNLDTFCNDLIKKFDKEKKNAINFVEFTDFMEYLWEIDENRETSICNNAINKSHKIFENLFDYLDRDNDGYLIKEDIKYGLSRVMMKDVDSDEVDNIYNIYDPNNFGKISKDDLFIAIANGMMDRTFNDDSFKDSFLIYNQ